MLHLNQQLDSVNGVCSWCVPVRWLLMGWSSKAGIRQSHWLSTAKWRQWFKIGRHRRRHHHRSYDPNHLVIIQLYCCYCYFSLYVKSLFFSRDTWVLVNRITCTVYILTVVGLENNISDMWSDTPYPRRVCTYDMIILDMTLILDLTLVFDINMPSVLWHCWLGGRKGIRPVKNWVVGCWCGYLSGARCRLVYVPADATDTHYLLLQ